MAATTPNLMDAMKDENDESRALRCPGIEQSSRWWFQLSNIFYFHPYLGKISILTNIFEMGWFNHQPVMNGLNG